MPKIIPVAIFDCIVFGATGDLTLRKLLPALYYRFRDGQMPAESRIIGAARSVLTDEDFRDRAAKALKKTRRTGRPGHRNHPTIPGATALHIYRRHCTRCGLEPFQLTTGR